MLFSAASVVSFGHCSDPKILILCQDQKEEERILRIQASRTTHWHDKGTCKPHPGGGWTKGRSALLALGETSKGRRCTRVRPTPQPRRAEKTGTRRLDQGGRRRDTCGSDGVWALPSGFSLSSRRKFSQQKKKFSAEITMSRVNPPQVR